MLENAVAQLAAVHRAVGEAADAVDGLRYGVVEALDLATIHSFAIDDDGVVHDQGAAPEMDDRDRGRIASELKDRVEQILRRAKDI